MSKRLLRAGWAAALLVAGALASPAFAKPPDLPMTDQDTFTAPAPSGQVIAGPGVINSNDGLVGGIIVNEQNYEVLPPDPNVPVPQGLEVNPPVRGFVDQIGAIGPPGSLIESGAADQAQDSSETCCPCCAALEQMWQTLADLFRCDDGQPNSTGAAEESDGNAVGNATESEAAPSSDTSEDLQRLVMARRMYLIGQRCLHKGDLDMARNCFQEAHLLAPASRYGRRAMECISRIEASTAEPVGNAEEQDQATTQQRDQDDTGAARQASARELYRIGERCRRSGDRGMAVNCYREVRALCPGSRCARRAQKRMAQMESEQATDEAAEPTEPQEEAAPDKPQGNAAGCSPMTCPPAKKKAVKKKKSLESLLRAPDTTSQNGKPWLNILEQQSAPTGGDGPGDNVSSYVLPLPLLVDPPARRLVIEQTYPVEK